MKNIDFPLYLEGIDLDKSPKAYYLTISVILILNDCVNEIIKVQEELLKDISAQSLIGSGIYKYPSDTIHFSIINFDGLASAIDNENEFKEKRKIHIDKIKNILQKFNKRSIDDKKVEFEYIFTKKSPSLAIQAFPSENLFELFEDMKDEFNKDIYLKPAEIKAVGRKKDRFPVNIVRFFRELSNKEYDILAEKISTLNKKCYNDGPFFNAEIKHISFVLSDDWLSNKNYPLSCIELN